MRCSLAIGHAVGKTYGWDAGREEGREAGICREIQNGARAYERQAPMSRRALDRFSVRQPWEDALGRYSRLYDGATLHYVPGALPEISSASLFGNAHPLALDLGCGRGEFLIDLATRHPACNYVG